jgi:hypothetical protein
MAAGPGCSGANRAGVCLFSGPGNFYDRSAPSPSFTDFRTRGTAMITTLSQAPDAVFLEAGDSFRTAVDAGTWLQVAEGRVRVSAPPRWIGEAVWTAHTVLGEGETHGVEHGGWIELTALSPVQLRIHAPIAVARRLPARAEPPAEPVSAAWAVPRRPVMRLMQLLTGW